MVTVFVLYTQEAVTQFEDKSSGYSEGIVPNDRSYLIHEYMFEDCGGKNHVFLEGTCSILDHILLPTVRDKIQLNTEVTKLQWSKNGQVMLHTTSDVITADHVIMTPSLGFMKENHRKMFDPALPLNKQKAIQEMTFGNVDKFCFLFDEPFWTTELEKNPNFSGYGFIYHRDEMSELADIMRNILGRKV